MKEQHQIWLARDMDGRLYAYDAEPSLAGMSDYVPASDADEIQGILPPFEPLVLCGQPPIEPGEKRLVTVTDATVTVERRVPYEDALPACFTSKRFPVTQPNPNGPWIDYMGAEMKLGRLLREWAVALCRVSVREDDTPDLVAESAAHRALLGYEDALDALRDLRKKAKALRGRVESCADCGHSHSEHFVATCCKASGCNCTVYVGGDHAAD